MPNLNEESIQHILIYECNSEYKGDPEIKNGNCFKPNNNVHICRKLINGWSKGADKKFYYPNDAAHPLNSDLFSYLLMEVHYNNDEPQNLGILKWF